LWNQGKDVLTSSGFLMTQEKAEKGFEKKCLNTLAYLKKKI